jgi:ribonuclease D
LRAFVLSILLPMEERPVYRYLMDAQEAEAALARLAGEAVLGLDTETFWDRETNQNRVSLIQLAPRAGEVLVVDVQATGIEVVRPLVESPTVMMAAHNARFDELVLIGATLQPAALIDTLRLSRTALVLASHSLAAVVAHLFGAELDKSLQQSNWRRRPLTRAQLQYAATDAAITLRVYEELKQRLEAEGRWAAVAQAAMMTGAPAQGARRRVNPKLPPPILTTEERQVVTRLKKWRLERAFAERVPAYMICPDRTLEVLAHQRPLTLDALKTIYGLGEAKIARYGADILVALREALA